MLHRKILALSRRYASSECNSNNSLNPRCIMVVAMASSVPSEIDWRRVLLIAAHTNYSDTLTYEIYEHDLIFHHKQLHIHYLQIIHKVLLEVPSAELPSSQSKNFFPFYSARPFVIYLSAATSLARMQQQPSLPHPYIPVYSMPQLRRRRLHPVERGGRQPMAGRPEVSQSLFNRPLCNRTILLYFNRH